MVFSDDFLYFLKIKKKNVEFTKTIYKYKSPPRIVKAESTTELYL